MIQDAVIDTNVLMHAQDSTCIRFSHSVQLLMIFLESVAVIRVDPRFTLNERTNSSLIDQEYLTHLQPGSVAFSFIQTLASTERVIEASRVVSEKLRKKSDQMIRKPRDRTFLRVAVNSNEQILISHDYEDFQQVKRTDIRKIFNVKIIEADEAKLFIDS